MRWVIAMAGALFGAAAAGLGLWAGQPSTEEAAVPATTSQPVVTAPAAEPVSLGPARLVPTGLALDGREVVFSYEIVDEAPASAATVFVNPDIPVVAPESWTMATVGGPVQGTTANIRATTARFPVPTGFSLDEVGSITLDSYRIRMPMQVDLELAWADTAPIAIDEDLGISVRRVLEQRSSTLVQLNLESADDPFASVGGAFGAQFAAGPRVTGRGPGWTAIGPVAGGVQLTFVGELPDPFPIRVVSSSWAKVERPFTIGVGGLSDG